jgi:hypothetical protein
VTLHGFIIPLAQGGLLVFAVLGLGSIAVRALGFLTLPWYWHLALIAILGQTTLNFLVQALLLSGESSVFRLKFLGWLIIALGLSGHLFEIIKSRREHSSIKKFRDNRVLKSLLIIIWLTNLTAALAPSAKTDDVYYHMLVPKRIAIDGTINFYRLPIEASIVPQMQYQISLSPSYSLGAPDAGNVLSLTYSIILGLFILGFIQDATGNDSLALLGGLGCTAGVYQTIWHTTEGGTAIGELALVVALCGALWPRLLTSKINPLHYGLLISTAASLAASTKISLIPLCAIITLFSGWRLYRAKDTEQYPAIQTAVVLLPWILIHVPLMIWTYYQSGSCWGPVMANVYGRSIFPQSMLNILVQTRIVNQTRFLGNLRNAMVYLCPLMFIGVGFTLWAAIMNKCRTSLYIICLFIFQGMLIWWQLPYDFRFVGGLLYLPLIATALMLGRTPDTSTRVALTLIGKRAVQTRNWIAIATVVPWLAFQIYYARPFAKVVLGVTSIEQFRERFLPLSQDYIVLDRILPADAVLYVANGRVPLFDAPRPVVLTPLDLRQKTSIYRMTVISVPDIEILDRTTVLNCKDLVYENGQAIVEAYRTPGKAPKQGTVTVRRCQIEGMAVTDHVLDLQ